MTLDWNTVCRQNETEANQKENMEVWFRKLEKENEGNIPYDILKFSESELYWASVTVGAPSDVVARRNYGDAPAFAIHKWSAICSVINFQTNPISLGNTHDMLDPSEKGVLSYWTGMIFAKLVAEKILHVPWAAHAKILYQTLKNDGNMQLDPPETKSLPDLVCYEDIMTYHIIEAKGRVQKPDSEQIKNYIGQTQRISLINGEEPKSRNACVTILKPLFRIDFIDPKKDPERKFIVKINPLALLKFYYEPVVAFLSEKEKETQVKKKEDGLVEGEEDSSTKKKNDSQIKKPEPFIYRDFSCKCIDKRKYRIGMVKEVFDLVKGWESGQISKQDSRGYLESKNFHETLKGIDFSELRKDELFSEGDFYIGSDGIVVQLFGKMCNNTTSDTDTTEK